MDDQQRRVLREQFLEDALRNACNKVLESGENMRALQNMNVRPFITFLLLFYFIDLEGTATGGVFTTITVYLTTFEERWMPSLSLLNHQLIISTWQDAVALLASTAAIDLL